MIEAGGVLGEIAGKTSARVAALKSLKSLTKLEAEFSRVPFDFQAHIHSRVPSVIAEIKFSSPSEGVISKVGDPVHVAKEYLTNGAAALSILTEPEYFGGRLEYIKEVRAQFQDSFILMKDFVVDHYQFALARVWGADAVLIIAALFETKDIQKLIREAKNYGLSALVEVHNKEEMRRAVDAGSTFIGVNNRDLKTLKISLQTSEDLFSMAPKGSTLVAESGISSGHEIKRFSDLGYRGFLVGTSLMKAGQPGQALKSLLEGAK